RIASISKSGPIATTKNHASPMLAVLPVRPARLEAATFAGHLPSIHVVPLRAALSFVPDRGILARLRCGIALFPRSAFARAGALRFDRGGRRVLCDDAGVFGFVLSHGSILC